MTFTDRSAHLALAARNKHLTAVLEEELKEPLTRLQTTLEKLAADPAGQLWPEANWVLRRLAADISRSSRLVDGVLSYQRFDAALDAGRETLDRRPVGLDQGHQRRSHRGCRAEPAQALRSDVQDVLGENRQQRRRPAQEHREHVE